MKRIMPVVVICAVLAAVFSYEPACEYVVEKVMRVMAVREQPPPKTFVKKDYEIKIKWEGTIWGGNCKMQMIFAKPPDELYESIDGRIGRMGRVVFLDKENYQVTADYCDKDFFTIETIGTGEALVYRHNFSCSAGDYDKICDVRYNLDNVVGKADKFRKR